MSFAGIAAAVLILGGLVVANGLLYRANKNVPLPEGCEDLTRPDCGSCPVEGCRVRRHDTEQQDQKEIVK